MNAEQRKRDMNMAIGLIEGVIDDVLMDAHHENRGPMTAWEIHMQTSLAPVPNGAQLILCVAKIMEEKGCLKNHGSNSVPKWSTTGTLFGRQI